MSLTSPTPKRVKTPSWLDLRLVAGVVLVLASVLIGAQVVARAHQSYGVLAVTHDLAAGSTLRSADVERVQVQLPDRGDGIYLADASRAVGRQLNRALARGELLPVAAVGTRPVTTTLSVPFVAGNAPVLRAGERIEVWLSTKTCRSLVLLGDVTVQDVRAGEQQIGASGSQDVVLGVSAPLAERVVAALAVDGAVIRAGVLSGQPSGAGNESLPALDSCLLSS